MSPHGRSGPVLRASEWCLPEVPVLIPDDDEDH